MHGIQDEGHNSKGFVKTVDNSNHPIVRQAAKQIVAEKIRAMVKRIVKVQMMKLEKETLDYTLSIAYQAT